MKSMTRRLLTLLLCLVMVASIGLASCSDGDDTSKTSQPANSTQTGDNDNSYVTNAHGGYNPETKKFFVNLPQNPNPDKKEFNVLVTSNEGSDTYFSEEIGVGKYETTDEALTTAVTNRNNKVLDLTNGVEIKALYSKNVADDVKTAVSSGLDSYDMAMPYLMSCPSLAQQNMVYNLSDDMFKDYIDLSMPWWDQNANESFSISNKNFFTVGDISIMQKIVSVALTFNKELLKQYYPDVNLYDVVEKGEWTFDKMVEMSRTATSDKTGEGSWTFEDSWGLSSSYGDAVMLYLASGQRLISKDENDIPVIAIGDEKSTTVAKEVLGKLQLKNEWAIHAQTFGTPNIWVTSLDIFGENRALFRTSAFSAIKKLRKYDNGADFGLIPLPKYDASQEKYFTPCSAAYGFGVVIPQTAPSPEFSAYMIEIMGSEAKNYITPAYYETILKSRDMKDEESEKMLDNYIFNNVVYDLGVIDSGLGLSAMFTKLMTDSSTDIASSLEAQRSTTEAKIQEIVDAYKLS